MFWNEEITLLESLAIIHALYIKEKYYMLWSKDKEFAQSCTKTKEPTESHSKYKFMVGINWHPAEKDY